MDSPASTPSQRQPHWIHSRLNPENPGQPHKGRTKQHQKRQGTSNTNLRPSTAQGQLAYTSCPSDLDWREPIPGYTNTPSAGTAATQKPTRIPERQPWMPNSNSNLTK